MHVHRTAPLLLSLLIVAAAALGTAAPRAAPRAAQDGEPPAGALALAMQRIERSMKVLRRSVRADEQRANSLAELEVLQSATLEAKLLVPPLAEDLEGAERAELLTAYRVTMARFLQRALELEIAVLEGDTERARALHAELSDLEDEGHARFAPGG